MPQGCKMNQILPATKALEKALDDYITAVKTDVKETCELTKSSDYADGCVKHFAYMQNYIIEKFYLTNYFGGANDK